MSSTCGRPSRPSPLPCNIQAEIKNRSGDPRWWCTVHGAPAWDPGGDALAECPGAGVPDIADDDRLIVDPDDYPGGVALWGAADPVLNTGPDPTDHGIHVHARHRAAGPKLVDATFQEVSLLLDDGVRIVRSDAARAFMVAAVFGLELKVLRCPRCGEVHLDAAEFAVEAHRKHQCNRCGRHFFDPDQEASISNPCADLAERLGVIRATPLSSTKSLCIEQGDFGGLAVWGSNPALVWTSSQPEESGIHVHGWASGGEQVIDDTYGAVTIDGVVLDPEQIRVLMVQRSLEFLQDRVTSLRCPVCNEAHLDRGLEALRPHATHICESCGAQFAGRGRRRKVVSNPMLNVVANLIR